MRVIKINGTVKLREDYKNSRDILYYAVLEADMGEIGCNFTMPRVKIEIPITRVTYNQLKEDLKQSQAESPVLRVNERLEIILGSECIN